MPRPTVSQPRRTGSIQRSGRRHTCGRQRPRATTKKTSPSRATGTPMKVLQALVVTLAQSMTPPMLHARVALAVKCSKVRYAETSRPATARTTDTGASHPGRAGPMATGASPVATSSWRELTPGSPLEQHGRGRDALARADVGGLALGLVADLGGDHVDGRRHRLADVGGGVLDAGDDLVVGLALEGVGVDRRAVGGVGAAVGDPRDAAAGVELLEEREVLAVQGLQRLLVAVLGLDGLERDDVAGVLRVLEGERRGVRVDVVARARRLGDTGERAKTGQRTDERPARHRAERAVLGADVEHLRLAVLGQCRAPLELGGRLLRRRRR